MRDQLAECRTFAAMCSIPVAQLVIIAPAFMLAAVAANGQNDECASAITMTVGTTCAPVPGHWIGASESQPADTCGGFASPLAADVWYVFTATSSVTIVEVQSADSNDAVLEVFSGACAALSSIACSDETLFGGIEPIALGTNVGETYFIRTYWWDYGLIPLDLEFTICVYEGPPAPANDQCANAIEEFLTVGSSLTFTGTTAGSDTSGDYAPGSALQGPDPVVWHAFTTTECAGVTISYCATDPAFDDVLAVLATGCPADSLVYAGSFDLLACGDGDATIHFDSLAAGTYYLPVLFDPEDANGPYGIAVDAVPCVVTVPENVATGNWHAFAVDGHITITGNRSAEAWSVDVFRADGRMIPSGPVAPIEDGGLEVRLSEDPGAGILYVRVRSATGSRVMPLWWF